MVYSISEWEFLVLLQENLQDNVVVRKALEKKTFLELLCTVWIYGNWYIFFGKVFY